MNLLSLLNYVKVVKFAKAYWYVGWIAFIALAVLVWFGPPKTKTDTTIKGKDAKVVQLSGKGHITINPCKDYEDMLNNQTTNDDSKVEITVDNGEVRYLNLEDFMISEKAENVLPGKNGRDSRLSLGVSALWRDSAKPSLYAGDLTYHWKHTGVGLMVTYPFYIGPRLEYSFW